MTFFVGDNFISNVEVHNSRKFREAVGDDCVVGDGLYYTTMNIKNISVACFNEVSEGYTWKESSLLKTHFPRKELIAIFLRLSSLKALHPIIFFIHISLISRRRISIEHLVFLRKTCQMRKRWVS